MLKRNPEHIEEYKEYITNYERYSISKKFIYSILKEINNPELITEVINSHAYFDSIDDYQLKHRTNNQVELFHRNLNQIIENSHPKISYLLDKLKMVIINKYNDYLIFDNKAGNKEVSKYDLFNDVFNFVKDF